MSKITKGLPLSLTISLSISISLRPYKDLISPLIFRVWYRIWRYGKNIYLWENAKKMIDVTIAGHPKKIKGHLSEITVREFEKLCTIVLEERSDILDKHLEIFSVLGMSDDDVEIITPAEFLEVVKHFTLLDSEIKEFQKEVTVDGKVYQAFTGDKFVLSVRDLARIEKYIKLKTGLFVGEMLAVIYKDPSLSKEENYKPEYLTEKSEMFRDKVMADVAYPYLNLITKDLTTTIFNQIKK